MRAHSDIWKMKANIFFCNWNGSITCLCAQHFAVYECCMPSRCLRQLDAPLVLAMVPLKQKLFLCICMHHNLHPQAVHRVAVAMAITLKPVITCALCTRFSTGSFYTNSLIPISTFWYFNMLASHKLTLQVIKKLEVGVAWIEANYDILFYCVGSVLLHVHWSARCFLVLAWAPITIQHCKRSRHSRNGHVWNFDQ